ncbi:hypothetical protein AVL63_12105 [Nesterenkonia jeotgali]|uniref:NlpC/P60 domain-containing protein n=2 Tax=Nesterenkonia jeotgali TaxID=317018 RepID=A0A0W8IIF0_9MICC|nr:hypothetical protein AVL63_12105 [Nesterenkonia jeotgali]
MADRAATAVEQNDRNSADSVSLTELPAVPSAKEISTARDSSQATEQMIDEISDRISQASQRALELETSMQEQHQAAVQAQVEADEAAAEADEARTAAEETQAAAAQEYQEPETSAAEVLLTEEDSLADAATDAQLQEQAELDAAAAEQAAAEAESLAEQARQNSTSAAEAEENADRATETTRTDVAEVGETLQGLLETLMELEGWEGDLQSFFEQILGNSDFIDQDGQVDHEQLTYRITTLRADAEQARITDEAAAEAAEAEEAAAAEAEEAAAAEAEEAAAAQAAEEAAAEAAEAEEAAAAQAAEEAAAEAAEAEEAAAAQAAAEAAEAEEAAAAQAAEEAAAAAAAEETSSEGAEGEAAPSEEPQPAPAPEPVIASFNELSTSMQTLMRQGAELESSFSGGAQDYYRAVLNNGALTNADGNASWNKMRWHVDYLSAQVEPEPEPEPTRAPAPEPTPAPAPERTQAPAPTQSQSQSQSQSRSQSTNVVPASSNSNGAEIAINWAVAQANRGDVRYVLGANGPNAFDCSSLVQQAFGQAGVSLSRTTFSQVNEGQAVSVGDMRRGDLVFFGSATAPGHVGIYLGNGQMVDASNPSRGLTVRSVYQTPSAVRRVL